MSKHETLDLWISGRFAGKLHRGESGRTEFIYDESYVLDPKSTPVSLAMPMSRLAHGYVVTETWLDNLVSENPNTRDAWARHFGETKADSFSLLRHAGLDAPGAVQVLVEGEEPSTQGSFKELTEKRIAKRLREIRDTKGDWTIEDDEDIRFSLAGQQSKFAIVKSGDTWLEPMGRSASTHIIKPGMQSMTASKHNDQAAEFLTMRAAKKLGLTVANVAITFFEDMPAFIVERSDRVTLNGQTLRIHQEDLCQALTVPPKGKYEVDGGPGIVDVASLISRHSSAPDKDREFFARAIVFNLMTAGIDGHGKNYSLLLSGNQVRFAPLYDLISAHPIIEPGRLLHKGKMGMNYGTEDRIRGINGRNLMRAADALGYDRNEMYVAAQSIGNSLPEALAQALEEMPDIPVTDRIRSLPQLTETFVQDKLKEISISDLDTPRYTAGSQLMRSHDELKGEVWVPGHHKDGHWVTGHYRRAPRTKS